MHERACNDATVTQVIAVTSGNGGVGKTCVAVNLATALANRGHNVMLLDGNQATSDVDGALGLHPVRDLSDVLRGSARLEDIIVAGPSGVRVVPAVAAGRSLSELGAVESTGVIAAFNALEQVPDVLVVDTAAGLGANTLRLIQAAGEVLVVLNDQATALRNAYSLIRSLRQAAGITRLRVLMNRSIDEASGRRQCDRLMGLVEHDVDATLHYVGAIPEDPAIEQALAQTQPVVNSDSGAPAARAFKHLARRTETWAPPSHYDGGVTFFVERLIRRDNLQQQVVTR